MSSINPFAFPDWAKPVTFRFPFMSTTRFLSSFCLLTLALGCGSGSQITLPDESGDLAAGTGGAMPRHLAGTTPAGPELGGTQWRWLESHCTEGPLGLAEQGYQGSLRIHADAEGLMLVQDNQSNSPQCATTVYQRYRPGATPEATWQMESAAHVSVPSGCGVRRDSDRPGDIRLRGSLLEVFVQRSNWCRGLELKMVYAQENPTLLGGEELARHYMAQFNRRDARGLAELFAVTGSLVEPFTESDTGTTRHEGRDAILRWYLDAFSGTPWLAMRVQSVLPGASPGQYVAAWEYMDPRLEEPLAGENIFTVAAGEVFETSIRISGAPSDSVGEGGSSEEP